MSVAEGSTPMIYYSLIAFNTKIICEVNEYNDNNTGYDVDTTKKEKKYIRASKKILKKIEQYEIRRPDGMGTLISGTYSYNYIHGYEYCNNSNYPLLESLIFLCVLPLYQSNPNVTSSEREIAFNFLSSIRRDFLTSFAEHLRYIYQHQYVQNIAVRTYSNNNNENNEYMNQLSIEDENISNNLLKLSHIMIQRMHGNYKNKFDYTPLHNDNNDDNINDNDNNDDNNNNTNGGEEEEEESEYINIKTPASQSNASNTENSNNTDSFIGVSMENEQDISTNTNNQMNGPGYGSISNSMNIDDTASQRSRINAFVESIVDVKQQMKDRISGMSISSIKSFGATMSDDKFVDFEAMPLIGSTTSMLGTSQYRNNYRSSTDGFVTRHRKKIGVFIAVLLIIYIIISMFCGWDFESCSAK